MTAIDILTEIVEVRQRIYGRFEELMRIKPEAISKDTMDREYLELLRAKLDLAQAKN